ncbi:efflux RND transporter permease subunit [Thermoproteota archaeon]
MLLSNTAIKNHLTVFVFVILIVFIGINAYLSMPREAAPDIEIPYIFVTTFYLGVSPTDMETLITNPIEKKLKGLNGVKEIQSISRDSVSSIFIEFYTDIDIDDALRKVKDKIDTVKAELPEDAEDPEVIEFNLSDFPMMVINVSGEYDLAKLKITAEKLQDKIETVSGVLEVTLSGGLEREIQILVDRYKLGKYSLSLNKISDAIKAENINIPGGTIDLGQSKYLVRVPGEFKSVEEINNVVIDAPDGHPIYLKDVALVRDYFKEKTTHARVNNIESVALSVQKRSGENVIRIANEIKALLEKEAPKLPKTTSISFHADQSEMIQEIVDELENSIMLGLILVVLVLFLFMGIRNSIFVATAIPLSMLIAFIILQTAGITLNMVVLFSLILALGMLVDNAIVIVENIYRFIEEGQPRIQAAMKATSEVAWPVIASTATTVAAFLPIAFMPGIPGKFMRYMPIGVISTISASLFVALIVNPVICSRFMKVTEKNHKKEHEGLFNKFKNFYGSILETALHYRRTTILLTLLTFVLTLALFALTNWQFEFFPKTTPDEVYINITGPEDATLENTNHIVTLIENMVLNHPNIETVITTVGSAGGSHPLIGTSESPNSGQIIIEFPDEKLRTESPFKTIEDLRKKVKLIPGAKIELTTQEMGPPTGAQIGIKLVGDDYTILNQLAGKITSVLESVKGVVDISDDYVKGRPEIMIKINRDKAAMSEVSTSMIAGTVRTAIQGTKVSVFREGNEEYDITLRFPEKNRKSIQDVEELIIPGPEGKKIPLLELAEIKTCGGTGSIHHTNFDRVITIEASTMKGYLPDERLRTISKQLSELSLPEGYYLQYVGESEMKNESASYLKKAFFLALLLITLILITQFNSIRLAFIIMISVVLSLIGIFFGLILFHRPFGIIMTGIGTISLAGVIVNNAIVLIDYIQKLRKQGMGIHEAVVTAGKVRLRPVLLTAITTILGLVPMTFGISYNFKLVFNNLFSPKIVTSLFSALEFGGQSNEFWSSMGSAVTIGLAVGTVLTLIVVPVLYLSLEKE